MDRVKGKVLVDDFGSFKKGDETVFEKSTGIALETREIIKITGKDDLTEAEKEKIKKDKERAKKIKANNASDKSGVSKADFETAVEEAVEAKLGPAVEEAVAAALEAAKTQS